MQIFLSQNFDILEYAFKHWIHMNLGAELDFRGHHAILNQRPCRLHGTGMLTTASHAMQHAGCFPFATT
jgi:hypothetical protein